MKRVQDEPEETTQTEGPVVERVRLRSERPRLVVVGGPSSGRQFPIDPEGASIGRSSDADITIEDKRMSRVHARFVSTRPGTWILEDLGSKNGTEVNGESITRKVLSFGDEIRMGESTFLFTHHNPVEEQILQRERMELLGRLGAGVAHDFNNLLSAARASLEFLDSLPGESRLESAEVRDCHRDIASAVRQATELSVRLLGMSRQRGYVVEPVDLALVCRDVVELLKRTISRSIAIELRAAPDLLVMGDRGQLHQVLMNLCVNARDAMPEGGTLSIAAHRQAGNPELTPGRGGGDSIVVTVSDTGVGMDAQTRQSAFEPFFSTKGERGGTGLGLSTVLEIVKYHGGAVDLQSEPGRGSVVRVVLPPAPMAASRPADTAAELPVAGAARPSPLPAELRVLVVDDNPVMRRSLARLLKAQGYVAVLAGNGQEGIEQFVAQRPDVVLLDFDLPVLSGPKTLEQLRAIDPEVSVVMMSGHATTTIEQMTDWGGQPPLFLQKPYGAGELREALARALARRART